MHLLWILVAAAAGLGVEEIIARIARGERGALRAAYDAFAGRAMAIALRILRSTEGIVVSAPVKAAVVIMRTRVGTRVVTVAVRG